jgi:hypothetical protein
LILNIFNRIESIYTKREREEWKRIKLTYKFDILAPTTLPPKFLKFLKLVIYIYTYILKYGLLWVDAWSQLFQVEFIIKQNELAIGPTAGRHKDPLICMCVYIYIYIHTYIHIYTHIYIFL